MEEELVRVIITDSNHIILSAVQPETVAQRVNGKSTNRQK